MNITTRKIPKYFEKCEKKISFSIDIYQGMYIQSEIFLTLVVAGRTLIIKPIYKFEVQIFKKRREETVESAFNPLVKNNFYPPCNRNKFLDTTIDFINKENLNNLSKYKTNLSKVD